MKRSIEKKLQEIKEQISSSLEHFKQITGKDLREIPDEELTKLPWELLSLEDLRKLKELLIEKKKIEEREYAEKEEIAQLITNTLEKVLNKGVGKGYVARSLPEVVTKEAQEFREKYFGDDPDLMAESYSTGWTIYDSVICRYGYEE